MKGTVMMDMLTPGEIAEAQRLCEPPWLVDEDIRARHLLPKALAHITAQAEQLRQAQAEGAIMREALLVAQERGIFSVADLCVQQIGRALSFTPAITAYAAGVARMEEALREIAEESPVRLDGWVRNRALAALEGDG